MSVKRKLSTDTVDEEAEREKRDRSESNISHSSWMYRLTAPTPTSTISEHNEEPKENHVEVKLDHPMPIKSTDDVALLHQNNSQSSGIWSWLGYSGPQPNESVDVIPADDNHEMKTIPEQAPQETTQSTPKHTCAQKPSYWKSLFVSTSTVNKDENNQDSVIISDGDEPEPNAINEDTYRKLPKPPSRHNIVLPTFESQFRLPNTQSSDNSNLNLFSKAINAINSIFTQKSSTTKPINSDWQDIHRLSTMIETMKNDPENLGDKKIVVIGVHGWFPMKLVRSVVGEPTGTSIKFCEQMTSAVKKYFKSSHDLDIPDKMLTNIPLQWEGKVMERVDKLYEYLISDDLLRKVKTADIILWTTHSQGTPVSAILLRKLIEQKVIDAERQPVCLLAMAGISHGPFPSLKGSLLVKYFEADPARELFDFMDSNSEISTQYREAMAYILQAKIKTVLVGSMQDQVVPLYSAIMSGISHPNILRAIYIDGHIYTKDDFLIRLITFALRLLNAGLSDHGFLIHISEVLAGNIYSWEGGHSTVYEELDVYILPLQYMFETPPFGSMEVLKSTSFITQELKASSEKAKQQVLDTVKARLDPFQAKLRLNPFHLPWAMRGIWDDPRILNDDLLSQELDALQALFDKWNPTSARLKEIKFRLEPLKARL